ncbi:MAG: hypothetical protein Q7J76_12375 [Candidatus Brocadiaceae bacterium]|nr:hypothetical protein [Candidatus Brocadiaceae bacterium]
MENEGRHNKQLRPGHQPDEEVLKNINGGKERIERVVDAMEMSQSAPSPPPVCVRRTGRPAGDKAEYLE